MTRPIATFLQRAIVHELDVRPSSDQDAGIGFLDPLSERYCIPSRPLKANKVGAARDRGFFRCKKQNASDVFAVGDQLTFSTAGVIAGSNPLHVVYASVAADPYVIAELNQPGTGGGGGGGGTSEPKRSEFVAIQDIPAGTPINANGATATYTNAIGLDYTLHDVGTAATFDDIYGRDLLIYANGLKVEQSDVSRNDVDPAGHVRFNVIIPNGSEIVFESQVVS